MKEKFIENKRIVLLIASVVAAALFVPAFISFFGDAITDRSIVFIIMYGLLLATDLVFVFYTFNKKEITTKALFIPILLFESAGILRYVYDVLTNDSWSSIFFIALYAGLLITYIFYMINNNEKLKIALYILILICLCFNLVAAFAGSIVELSMIITNLIFISSLYFIPKGGEQQ